MSATRVNQSTQPQLASSSAARRRSSLVVNLSSSSKKRLVTTTTHRTTVHSGSPLDDLRAKLADYSKRSGTMSMPSSSEDTSGALRGESSQPSAQSRADMWPQPKSAPALLSHKPDYSSGGSSSTSDNVAKPSEVGAVAEVFDERVTPNQESSKEPIVEVKNSSTSSSASSSPCHSPLSSRQSSDCGATNSAAKQEPTSGSSFSASARKQQQQESSSSSSRTIRRRTVRRSYHTRATEESKESAAAAASPLIKRVLSTSTIGTQLAPCTPEEEEEPSKEARRQVSAANFSTSSSRQQQQQQQQVEATTGFKSEQAERRSVSSVSSSQAIDLKTLSSSRSMNESQTNSSTSLFERRNRVAEVEQLRSRRSVETEEESIRRESFNSSRLSGGPSVSLEPAASTATFGEASLSRHQQQSSSRRLTTASGALAEQQQSDVSSSSSFKTSSFFANHQATADQRRKSRPFLDANDVFNGLFSSQDVRNLVQEIGTEFAELENALGAPSVHLALPTTKRTPSLLGPWASSAPTNQRLAVLSSKRTTANNATKDIDTLIRETNSTIKQMEANPPVLAKVAQSSLSNENSQRIKDLLNRANTCTGETTKTVNEAESRRHQIEMAPLVGPESGPTNTVDSRRTAVMNESIVRIDQRMSDLCQKLEQTDCRDTEKAIDLLKVMIQMIEKAWSVPVCGDDLGFKLCNSLRQAGGLDIILATIQHSRPAAVPAEQAAKASEATTDEPKGQQQAANGKSKLQPLKLDLISASQKQTVEEQARKQSIIKSDAEEKQTAKDNDSDTFTSDLGLDSTSVESLSYVSAAAGAPPQAVQTPPPSDESPPIMALALTKDQDQERPVGDYEEPQVDSEELERMRKEELVFLSARLLSQCLTSDNRDYIVQSGQLDPVIKLACRFATMKSKQSKRLLKRSALMSRQSSSIKLKTAGICLREPEQQQQQQLVANTVSKLEETNDAEQQSATSDVHSAIGTEILQHLFKHSEETCSRMISLGALQAILYGCRLSHTETLRHCASALANLALYGGSDSQQTMIEQKAHVWLFPLAFNEADNVQYYACLAIVVLAANQEIEADVLKSGTLDLVEPFVTTHEPRQFAESTTAHVHGQSASWLRKLIPLLESKREEARNLACFHFAMEAYIKREQGQSELFKQIGAIEALKRAGSSPIAIASRFACQALRLIGEKEPHKLSQQVPLWTCQDVCEWVSQIGFEKFRPAFRESHVDGDLLLQLDEEMLKFDIGLENGIIRRRFMRELSNLKRIADYSSVDRTGLGQLLIQTASQALEGTANHQAGHQAHGGGKNALMAPTTKSSSSSSASVNSRDFVQYIYPILQLGVTRDNIHLVDRDQLLAECKISNALHRIKLAHSIGELQERMLMEAAACEEERQRALAVGDCEQMTLKTLDVFVSYRRSTGSQLASLLKVHLQLRGLSVFIDVERLEAGKFDNNLLDSIKSAKNFVLVLSPNALDRCIGDHECKDWVHKEIVAALASNCNIIPIIDNFHWPDPEQLPEDMRSITYFNGVRWIHDYQDACVDKVERFIRGEFNNAITTGSIISTSSCSQSQQQQQQQQQSNQQNAAAQQRLTSSGQSTNTPNIPSTPSIYCNLNSSAGGSNIQSTCSATNQVSLNRNYLTSNINNMSATGKAASPLTHPSESDSHPLAFANQHHHQFSGSLSTGPSNYRLR